MAHRWYARSGWLGAALLTGWLQPTPAQAAIPYDMQLTPGQLRGIAYAPGDPWLYGYWEYLPTNYDEFAPGSVPLLVFLAGIGEYDDVSSCPGGADVCAPADCGFDGLCRNLTWGPQELMQDGEWDEALRPFIFVSPQHNVPPFTTGPWDVDRLDDFLQFIVDNYDAVDQRRMYLIGMSQGGRGTLQYTQAYPRRLTAVAPAPGGQVDEYASCFFEDTALWVFHGEDDADGNLGPGVFAPCNMVNVAYQYNNPGLYVGSPQCVSIAGQPRPEGRLTMYYNVAHFSWVQTVDPIGEGFPANEWPSDQGCGTPATFREYEPGLDPDGVYSWFLSLDRPRVEAPADFLHDQPEVSLTAVVTDDDPITYEWTQIGGPPATLNNTDTDTLDVSDLMTGEQYTFDIFVVDSDGQWDRDEVIVTMDEMFGGGESSGGASSSSDGGGESSGGESGAGDTTTDSADGTTGGGADGSTSNTSGVASTGADDTMTPDGTRGSADQGSGAVDTTAGPGGSSGTSDGPGATGDPGGCGCRAERPVPGWWAWAMVLMALRRRRRAIA